jgi:hypothetical protein
MKGALAFAILCVACGAGRSTRAASDAPSAPDSIFVTIVNDNYYDARIHLIYEGGTRYPLGTIASNHREPVVTIPWLPRAFVVEVDLVIGGGVYRSEAMDVARGEFVEIRVPADLSQSGFFRRVRR